MWQRFTEAARKVVFYSQTEAGRFGDNMVSDTHFLLALLRDPDNKAGRILSALQIDTDRLRTEVESHIERGDGETGRDLQLTSRAKRIIDLACDEARGRGDNFIGTEHLLLGFIRESDGVASRTLGRFGLDRDQVYTVLGTAPASDVDEGAPEQRLPAAPSAPDASRTSGKWVRFTERARKVIFYAQEEAHRTKDNFVAPEHLLLGLVRENDSVAGRILSRLGVAREDIRARIEREIAHGVAPGGRDMQLTPRSKHVIDLAFDEARELGNSYIGTEHILLALIRDGDSLSARVLAELGVELERTRDEVARLQSGGPGNGGTA
jgi:ATP-dependent Clp protease ATP-binding subunit ClpA